MRELILTSRFKKDYKRISRRNKPEKKFEQILHLLLNDLPLPEKCNPHKLIGNFKDKWECHIEPDWLLVYEIEEDCLKLVATGSHSDLFG